MIISNQKNEAGRESTTIQIPGSIGDLSMMQNALITLIAHFDFENEPAREPVYFATQLLRAIMPNEDQLKTGIKLEQITESLTDNSK